MATVAGILLLVFGVLFPMAMLVWLIGRMRRRPAPRPRQVGLWLALNFVLPVGLALAGLGLLSEKFRAAPTVRIAAWATLAAAGVLVVGLIAEAVAARRIGGRNGQ